ncbi:MAG: hypothetical protein ACO3VF_01075 [Tamlana sp.]
MLSFYDKTITLESYLFEIKDNYSDSFKADIYIYLDELENVQENEVK